MNTIDNSIDTMVYNNHNTEVKIHCIEYFLLHEVQVSVRRNLAVHCSVTPFIIRQPIQRPRLLERVYKPMRTSH